MSEKLNKQARISRRSLLRLYWKTERFIVPSLKYSQTVYEEVLTANVLNGMRWLDLGCGHQILPAWRFEQEKQLTEACSLVVGIDPDESSLNNHRTIRNLVHGDASALPFAEHSFDLVTANMVMEHLENPVQVFQEVHRVLSPGGRFIFHTPNSGGYVTQLARALPERLKLTLIGMLEDRPREDVFPTFYRANKEKEIRQLAQSAGFVPFEIRYIATSAEFGMILPLAILELLWIRLLLTKPLRHWRTNLIVTLQKQGLESSRSVTEVGVRSSADAVSAAMPVCHGSTNDSDIAKLNPRLSLI